MPKLLTPLVVLAMSTILAACEAPAPDAKAPRPIRSVVVQAERIGESIVQTGEIRPRHETPLGFRIAGELRSRLDVGRAVATGDVVATIDAIPARNEVLSSTAEVEVAEAALALADQTAQRVQELFGRAVASRVQVQDAEANLRTARARLDVARANLAKAKETLRYAELRAPHAGTVASTAANSGQTVAAGQTVLTLVSTDEREAVFDVPERLVSGSDVGDPTVEVSLISNPSVTARGKIREVAPASDATTRTFRVRIALDTGSQAMPLGSAVVGRIVLDESKLHALPASALTRSGEAPAVLVFDTSAGVLRARPVTVARYDGERILISAGLKDGDIVAIAGVSKLRDGEKVTLDQETAR